MALPVAEYPRWPNPDAIYSPEVEVLPMVNPADPVWTQVKDWITGKPLYRISRDYFTYCPTIDGWIFLPTNFVFDYASVPRVFTFIMQPNGILGYGAGPHDFGIRFGGMMVSHSEAEPYWFQTMDKPLIDKIFVDLNNKYTRIRWVNEFAGWLVRKFGPEIDPIDMDTVDWSQEVHGKNY